jgi:hypothetical protein
MPRACAAIATSVEASTLTVLVSINTAAGAIAAMRPVGPSIAPRNAVSSGSDVTIAALPRTASAGEAAIEMPCARASLSRASLRSNAVTA